MTIVAAQLSETFNTNAHTCWGWAWKQMTGWLQWLENNRFQCSSFVFCVHKRSINQISSVDVEKCAAVSLNFITPANLVSFMKCHQITATAEIARGGSETGWFAWAAAFIVAFLSVHRRRTAVWYLLYNKHSLFTDRRTFCGGVKSTQINFTQRQMMKRHDNSTRVMQNDYLLIERSCLYSNNTLTCLVTCWQRHSSDPRVQFRAETGDDLSSPLSSPSRTNSFWRRRVTCASQWSIQEHRLIL